MKNKWRKHWKQYFLNWLEFIWSHEYNNIHCEILKGMVFLKWGTIILGIATQTRKKKCEKKSLFLLQEMCYWNKLFMFFFFFFSRRDIKRFYFFVVGSFSRFKIVLFFFTRFGTLLLFCTDQSQHGGASSKIISEKGRQFLSSCFYVPAVCLQATCPPLASVS